MTLLSFGPEGMSMRTSLHRPMSVVVVALALSAVLAFATPAAAAKNVTFHLYVGSTEGWGFTNTSLSIPGPTLAVGYGDNVTLILNATSGTGHRWYIDYNNDNLRSAGEPQSPFFSAGLPSVSWNFTASRNGTFVYRDRAAPTQWGLIVIGSAAGAASTATTDVTALILVGIAAAVVAVIIGYALGWTMARRPEKVPPPPPPEGGQP